MALGLLAWPHGSLTDTSIFAGWDTSCKSARHERIKEKTASHKGAKA
jgi:hypothetical protein